MLQNLPFEEHGDEFDQDWPKKSLAYQQLERKGAQIIKARRYMG